MFFIAESIQSFSGIIFYAPKIGDISSVVQFVSQTKSDCFSSFLIDSVIFIFFSCEYCAFYIFLSPFPLSWNRQICPK